uniref:BRCT domain-containing protein n=1 Tax=Gasterosteus aculeatus aculeatus TaxID=481459 RepID=A0AAQ4Q1U3_GASAC
MTMFHMFADVVVYVDVWSSDKTANYSKPFVQQLQEMGAQVSKSFNKQVTHVVFNNGHLATWKKAKKNDVRLVSVLWVGRCYDDGVRLDEEMFPAFNDERNPVLKNKRHRCMQPKDSPERTPENDRRMRKKLDKMMKDMAPKQPFDVSPIIIDEENGIVYSPALKRSDYMAQRLKDMKEKRENLSPTGMSSGCNFCESTTHVVSWGHRRTLNILLGIARGCWILSFEWILWCLEQRQWIPEEPYELSDQFPAAQICRLQRHLSAGEHQQDLFHGQPAMFVSQHSQPPTHSLEELIQLCGGTVTKSVRQAGICIGKHGGRRPEGSRVLSEQWVLDSITRLKRLSYDNYLLE